MALLAAGWCQRLGVPGMEREVPCAPRGGVALSWGEGLYISGTHNDCPGLLLSGVGASPAQEEGTEGLFQGMHQLQVDDAKLSFWAFKISPGCGGICLGCGERTGMAGHCEELQG